ncbi:unnamed protein product [Dicrocoelium dendriticum]|nr:unnamed protein product [Dicrocoelium dendriticum]
MFASAPFSAYPTAETHTTCPADVLLYYDSYDAGYATGATASINEFTAAETTTSSAVIPHQPMRSLPLGWIGFRSW